MREVSRRGTRFVARFEGFVGCPYRDPVGVWTRGYGETRGIGPGSGCISKRRARKDLHRRLNGEYNAAKLLRHLDLKQCEVDALASLAYNLGPGILTDPNFSTLARRLAHHKAREYWRRKVIYRQELPKWIRAGGSILPGLVTRRNAEVRLATQGKYR